MNKKQKIESLEKKISEKFDKNEKKIRKNIFIKLIIKKSFWIYNKLLEKEDKKFIKKEKIDREKIIKAISEMLDLYDIEYFFDDKKQDLNNENLKLLNDDDLLNILECLVERLDKDLKFKKK